MSEMTHSVVLGIKGGSKPSSGKRVGVREPAIQITAVEDPSAATLDPAMTPDLLICQAIALALLGNALSCMG
ncbi:hypothetical protein AB4084_41510, partial [Lysobacter sp. 2RAB21]